MLKVSGFIDRLDDKERGKKKMCVRRLDESEIKQLREIYNGDWAEVYYLKMRQARSSKTATYGFFNDEDDTIVSEITLLEMVDHEDCSKSVEVAWYGTEKSKCNQGYGSSVLKYAINVCKVMGYKCITVAVDKSNEIARYIYEKHGFKYDGRAVNINKVVYTLSL